jgi:hypothetical protein
VSATADAQEGIAAMVERSKPRSAAPEAAWPYETILVERSDEGHRHARA